MSTDNSLPESASRPASRMAALKTQFAAMTVAVRVSLQKVMQLFDENPHIVRCVAVSPLLITWFIGIHKEEYRSASYRGFLLSTLFLLCSGILYWIIDLLHLYLENEFLLQWIAFIMQAILSLVYIGFSIRLVAAEYRRQELSDHLLDRWKDRLLQLI